MIVFPAVLVHDRGQARVAAARAVALGRGLVFVSAPHAGAFGGVLWWRAILAGSGAWDSILDCGDSAGQAMAALRAGQAALVLDEATPGFAAVVGAAWVVGAIVLTQRPACLDMAANGAGRRLDGWLLGAPAAA